jgi:hypothetical protein
MSVCNHPIGDLSGLGQWPSCFGVFETVQGFLQLLMDFKIGHDAGALNK